MTLEELQAENDKLKAELIEAQNNAIRAQLDALKTPATAVAVEPSESRGMTASKGMRIIEIAHQTDPKTGEKIAPTVRQDMGVDPTQRFHGRQP